MTPTTQPTTPLANAPSFMEQQFPVAKVSMESYKERTAKQSQTLTGLGKWWGRKPLILVRAVILGLLMPASDNPEKDREIFLKLMTMDRDGLWRRKDKPINGARLLQELAGMPPGLHTRFVYTDGKLRRLDKNEKDELQRLVFERMNYAEKLEYCQRPEHLEDSTPAAWDEINAHLGTQAHGLNELVRELGEKRFGHTPRIGDVFCGGGSIPFEAARLGGETYGSDLNPVAAALTWAAINVIGGNNNIEKIATAKKALFVELQKQFLEFGIEHNSLGWQADYYLYCVEVINPETGWKIPLLPSFAISPKYNAIANLVPDYDNKRYDVQILEGVSDEEYKKADASCTIKDSRLVSPEGGNPTPIEVIRQGMRKWGKNDVTPQIDDVFQERLYCIRWVETNWDDSGKEETVFHYRAATTDDLFREKKVLDLLQDQLPQWQTKGYIPNRRIESGYNTDQPTRERGWTYWHHLFSPRQLLMFGTLTNLASKYASDHISYMGILLGLSRSTDYNSKLCRWHPRAIGDKSEQTFSNQALNTLNNYAVRGTSQLPNSFLTKLQSYPITGKSNIKLGDARDINDNCDLWITDPPYADAINYEEITEYFLSWYEPYIRQIFPTWYTDSKRALAVKGNDNDFKQSMVACYRRLAENMPDNGMQVVMFTHQDAAVWADLTMILWAAGLRVTAAWTIATETDSALKAGNYVQGTVLLVLRKRTATEPVFLDEVNQQVESEVRRQLDEMTKLEDDSDPNFGDSDYQLAAYAAALRVLTSQPIEEINPEKEILRPRKAGETGPVEALIRRAVKIACDHLVPRALDGELWKQLNPAERFYLKGLEVESHGEYRAGVYQELARGFGANDYTDLLESTKANETRLKSASEFGKKGLSGEGFSGSLVRQCLFAVTQVSKNEETRDGLNYLKTELPDYWANREKISHILAYLAVLKNVSTVAHWHKDAASASLLLGAVRNDHV